MADRDLLAEVRTVRAINADFKGEVIRLTELLDAAAASISALTERAEEAEGRGAHLVALVGYLRAALEQWKCDTCGGTGILTVPGANLPCLDCGDDDRHSHPIARAALKATE